jgi:hypothetical protein
MFHLKTERKSNLQNVVFRRNVRKIIQQTLRHYKLVLIHGYSVIIVHSAVIRITNRGAKNSRVLRSISERGATITLSKSVIITVYYCYYFRIFFIGW